MMKKRAEAPERKTVGGEKTHPETAS